MLGTLQITFDDGTTKDVVTKPSDGIAFERQFKMSLADALPSEEHPDRSMRMEHLWFFAWNASRRDGEEREFDQWIEAVAAVGVAAVATPTSKRARTPSQ